MAEVVEITIITPKNKKMEILVPKWLCEEFAQRVNEENLSQVITEALANELKKVRFRIDLEKSFRKAGLK